MKQRLTYQRGCKHMPKHQFDDLLSRQDLLAQGWTDTLIKRHLPDPDDYRDNPHYRSAPPRKFWLRTRVDEVETRAEVVDAMAKIAARREARDAKKRANKTYGNPDMWTPERIARFESARKALAKWRAERAQGASQ